MEPSKTNQTRWGLHHNTFHHPYILCHFANYAHHKPSKNTLPYPHPLNEHSTQHCSLHSLPHKRQSISAMSSSIKISQHKLHSNMLYRPSTAHAPCSFYVRTRQTISAMLSSNCNPQHNSVSIHMNMHYTHPGLPTPLPSTTLVCIPLTQNIVGKKAQDVGMVESIAVSSPSSLVGF